MRKRVRAECACVRVVPPGFRLHNHARVGCRETRRRRAETCVYAYVRVMSVTRVRALGDRTVERHHAVADRCGLVAAPFVRRCAPRRWLATRPRSGKFLRSPRVCASATVGVSLF